MQGHDISACMRATAKNMKRIRSGITSQMQSVSEELAKQLGHTSAVRGDAWEAHKAYIHYAREHRKAEKEAVRSGQEVLRDRTSDIVKLRQMTSDAHDGISPDTGHDGPEM